MKILYIFDKMPDVYQNYLLQLLSSIKRKMLVKTLVYQNSDISDYEIQSNGFKERLHRLLYKLKLANTKSLDLKIIQKFDIIHYQHSYLWKKILPVIELNKRPKIVITLRGGDTYIKPWTYYSLANFYKDRSKDIAAFVVMSKHQKKYLERWGINSQKIYTIPISFGESSKANPKFPNEGTLKLVSAFRMTWEKNIDGTIQFAKCLMEKGVPFIYDIYGSGQDLDQLYFLVDHYNLKDHIRIKGEVENDYLKGVLPKYDFFVQLSISESLGMSVIEAQSLGLPCIISNAGGLPEVVVKDKTAVIADYNDIPYLVESCLNLWQNKEMYYTFSQNAIDHANANFTINKEMERLKLLYEKLCD